MGALSKILKKYGLYLVVGIIWILLRRQDVGYEFEHASDVYLLAFILLSLVAHYIGNLGKYKTAHFISDGAHGSCSVEPVTVDMFTLFRLGGVKHPPIPYIKGNEATVIVNKQSWQKIGDNYVSTARVKPTDRTKIPYQLMPYIEKAGYSVDNVYIGFSSDKLETSDPEVLQYSEMIDELNSIIDTYRNATKGKLELAENVIKGVERMGSSIKGKKRFKIFRKDDEDEDER